MKFSRRQALVASALVPTAPVWAKKRKSAILPPATDPFEEVTERLLALLPDTATYNGTPGSVAGGPLARRMDEARVELQEALQIDPSLELARIALGELFTRRK